MVRSDSSSVWRIATTCLLTSRSSVMTSSWQGASFCGTSTGGRGWVSAWASLRVRATGVSQPNIRSTISMLANRFVTARAAGYPLTFLNRIGQLPSSCFCTPVTSRSGSTGASVSRSRSSCLSHSSVPRSDWRLRSSFTGTAMASPPPWLSAVAASRSLDHSVRDQPLDLLVGQAQDLPVHPRVVLAEERARSEEHTSELQSHSDLVCRLLLEKKKKNETK